MRESQYFRHRLIDSASPSLIPVGIRDQTGRPGGRPLSDQIAENLAAYVGKAELASLI